MHKKVLYCNKFTTVKGCRQLDAFISEDRNSPPTAQILGLQVEEELAEISYFHVSFLFCFVFVVLSHLEKKMEEIAEGGKKSFILTLAAYLRTVEGNTMCLTYVYAEVSWRFKLLICLCSFNAMPFPFTQYWKTPVEKNSFN